MLERNSLHMILDVWKESKSLNIMLDAWKELLWKELLAHDVRCLKGTYICQNQPERNWLHTILNTGRYTEFLNLLLTLFWFRILLRKFRSLIANVAKLLNKNKLDNRFKEFKSDWQTDGRRAMQYPPSATSLRRGTTRKTQGRGLCYPAQCKWWLTKCVSVCICAFSLIWDPSAWVPFHAMVKKWPILV